MSLFKTGDATYDQYATYSTEKLIQIVTDTTGSYQYGVVDTVRRILLARGFDYRTKEQKAAENNATRASTYTASTTSAAISQSRARINRRNRPANKTGLKAWHWIWIIWITIRMISCLMQHG